MKKVYLIYAKIPSLLFDNKIHLFVRDSSEFKLSKNHYIGLYAWTKNKELLNTFLDFRKDAKDIYNVIEREFDKDDYKHFKKVHSAEELMYYRFKTCKSYDMDHFDYGWVPKKSDSDQEKDEFFNESDNVGRIVCTTTEYNETMDYGEQFFFEYLSQIMKVDYLIFKDEYIWALDRIGYCDAFNLVNNDSEDPFYSARSETSEYNNNFGLTYYGNPAFNLWDNKLALFINIFYEMIIGYDPNREIKLLSYNN